MKKQVLSFSEFINEAYKIINEAGSSSEGSFDGLKKLLGGGLGLSGSALTSWNSLIDRMDGMGVTSAAQEEALGFAQEITDFLNSKEEGVKIKSKGLTSKNVVNTRYNWLVNGTVRVKGNPSMRSEGDLASGTDDDTSVPYPLADVIRGIFLYNLEILKTQMGGGAKQAKKDSNYGKKSKNKGSKFLTIDVESLNTDIIQVVPYEFDDDDNEPSGEYGFRFPIFTIGEILKGQGKELSKDTYTEVIPPIKNENTEEVTDLAYNSSGTNFFAENKVEIGEDGKAAINSILSEFNSISKIVVNGGASSKATSRAGGNEQLAKDRMKAGIAALNQLKKDGVEQLKNASIVEGKAEVQSGAASESDPKNQQVSFIISGFIRKIEDKGESKEVIIQRVDKKKADKVRFDLNYIYCSYDIS